MKRRPLALKRARIQNFKALRDTGWIDFTPLTVLIGNNGSGKSSLIEGLETLRDIAVDGLDEAMGRWRGYEHIRNNQVRRKLKMVSESQAQHLALAPGERYFDPPMGFHLVGHAVTRGGLTPFQSRMEVSTGPEDRELFFVREQLTWSYPSLQHTIVRTGRREAEEVFQEKGKRETGDFLTASNRSVFRGQIPPFWQFLRLTPDVMGQPQRIRLTAGRRSARLDTDGANLAEYLLNISRQSPQAFQSILSSLRYVLPYATELQVASTSEIERLLYLQMSEGGATLPGWLLSTGTLRIVALLAVLRHPEPPPVLIVEEIENGLDPRTIQLIVEEIRTAVEYSGMQIILTTHSPYLLDIVPLSSLLLCERDAAGQPTFYRPKNDESMQRWTRDFAPGKLYTMGQLRRQP